jgi:hypothetical protein
MSIRVACPSCRKAYNLDESQQGKTVLCRECRSPITVPAPQGRRADGGRPADDRIATSARPAGAAGPAGRDEEGPRRRPAERPARREAEAPSGGRNLLPIILGCGGAALVLVGLVIGGVVLIFLRPGSKQAVAAAKESSAVPAVPAADKVDPAAGPAVPFAGGAVPPPGPPADPPAAAPPPGPEAAVPAGPVPAEMAADVVRKVKQSTAYLRVRLPSGELAQGSGFFALEPGIVITNGHVVGMLEGGRPPRGVEVVIHSGEAGEATLAGTVLGVDRDNDLAVLRVGGGPSRLPPPLPIDTATALTELQKLYIFGFPFGAQLGKNITVTASSVGALRRSGGVLKQVQVNGGMHPGNSGGPVADARGVVVGVSVAGINGTQINFAVPADFIRPLVARSKSNPLNPNAPPGPLARNDPPPPNDLPAGAPPGAGPAGDLAALRGTWQSGPVPADGGQATGTVKLSISPNAGGAGGRMQLHISTRQAGRTTSSTSSYSFTLRQNGGERALVTNVSRLGRGIVLVYRFEGGRLVVSGAVASRRFGYTLKNVPLRRTSAEPEQPAAGNPAGRGGAGPAAGGGGRGSPAALKFSGDVFAFVQEAVRDKRLADVDIRGFTLSQKTYRDVCEEGGVLIGFQVGLGKFGDNETVNAVRPIYRTKSGEKFGQWHGPAPASPVTLKAKPGYVVSGLSLRTGLGLDALSLVFTKLGPNGYVSGDTYNSEQAGGNGGGPSTAGGNGALFVGVTGHLGGNGSPCSLGLVAVLPKD